ncbi:hypothetical protein [Dellaglioa algida]|uniref:Uncharacterized protein n=1 Tax=Dellaglioa algida TaxID=105612 RepID=A0A5C6M761_9LACO|nr:hypothetical protein [Dellaglioa algida]MDK1720189.1 hypothetical protein [Dellaglioa algida]MDK1723579.1 hypothetical protein [Dellaglioa algida]TWW10508.1 hypothetical protein LABALGLTS371_12910 [Dellaglioa algida]
MEKKSIINLFLISISSLLLITLWGCRKSTDSEKVENSSISTYSSPFIKLESDTVILKNGQIDFNFKTNKNATYEVLDMDDNNNQIINQKTENGDVHVSGASSIGSIRIVVHYKNKIDSKVVKIINDSPSSISTPDDQESDVSESITNSESKKKQSEQTSESIKKVNSSASNTVYGQFKDDGFDERSAGYYVQTISALKIGYSVGEDNSIKVIKIDSRKLPYSLSLDEEAINEQITDYTAPDAKLTQTISNKEFIYHSDKLNKNYKIRYQLNTDGELTIIFINQN